MAWSFSGPSLEPTAAVIRAGETTKPKTFHRKSASDTFAHAAAPLLQGGTETSLLNYFGPESGFGPSLFDDLLADELLALLGGNNDQNLNKDGSGNASHSIDGGAIQTRRAATRSRRQGTSSSGGATPTDVGRSLSPNRPTGFIKLKSGGDKPAPNFATQTRANAFDPKQLEPKRAKRIIANRQSAHRSRMKKMVYVHTLEKDVEDLQAEMQAINEELGRASRSQRELLSTAQSYRSSAMRLGQQLQFQQAMQQALQAEVDQLQHMMSSINIKSGTTAAAGPSSADAVAPPAGAPLLSGQPEVLPPITEAGESQPNSYFSMADQTLSHPGSYEDQVNLLGSQPNSFPMVGEVPSLSQPESYTMGDATNTLSLPGSYAMADASRPGLSQPGSYAMADAREGPSLHEPDMFLPQDPASQLQGTAGLGLGHMPSFTSLAPGGLLQVGPAGTTHTVGAASAAGTAVPDVTNRHIVGLDALPNFETPSLPMSDLDSSVPRFDVPSLSMDGSADLMPMPNFETPSLRMDSVGLRMDSGLLRLDSEFLNDALNAAGFGKLV
eukprot:CAMPEP_0202908662 /NCGR_PEP_ID=MMETSP1392-20130828/46796_1 /ASSEMBLY_ACC=CAM_ASM_000868 /TAXON_ID=225041 /ORGANISM="Chlamydomonas chlamydogama, Strain SAG 11-48b" /LENGTH=553 /DNA_ID=CAMNT_0049598099 /DNA_START=142 /DNA_END=1803 /DNA_ORIENTATION=-